MAEFLCGRFKFSLKRPLVMGILNVTPDSFSDAGRYATTNNAIDHAHHLIEQGADILDIGGESTRPGATPVAFLEERARVMPILQALQDCEVALSVDTYKPEMMKAALDMGADMINDICGFREPGAIEAIARSNCGACIMHMQGAPLTMQHAPTYQDLLKEIESFLKDRAQQLCEAGVQKERIVLDPGFGFGKSVKQNYELLNRLSELHTLGFPLLAGLSRKSMLGHFQGRPVKDRLPGSLAAALACVARGAFIVRVHDVLATIDALNVWEAIDQGFEAQSIISPSKSRACEGNQGDGELRKDVR